MVGLRESRVARRNLGAVDRVQESHHHRELVDECFGFFAAGGQPQKLRAYLIELRKPLW